MADNFEYQLKEACQLTGAVWAVLTEREGGSWFIRASYHLSKSKQPALTKFLAQESVDSWLAGAIQGNSTRSASLPAEVKLDASRLHVYPQADTSRAILVGGNQQDAGAQRIWKLVASLMRPPEAPALLENVLPSLLSDLPYDMPGALEKLLKKFVDSVGPQGAWLAIRRGDTLDILVDANDPRAVGISIAIESNRLLRRMNRTLTDIAAEKDQPEWEDGNLNSTLKSGNGCGNLPDKFPPRLRSSLPLMS